MHYEHFTMSLVLGCVLLGVVSEGWATSGNQWLGMTEASRTVYIMGLVEGWQGLLGVEEEHGDKTTAAYLYYKRINACIMPMTFGQMKAILEKHLKDNPNQWHYSMESTSATAFYNSCPKDEK